MVKFCGELFIMVLRVLVMGLCEPAQEVDKLNKGQLAHSLSTIPHQVDLCGDRLSEHHTEHVIRDIELALTRQGHTLFKRDVGLALMSEVVKRCL